jgi:siroheme synthase-like protein
VSLIPLGFHGESVSALVVGGGRVGTRRAVALLESGARVRVIAPMISPELEARRGRDVRLIVEQREYAGGTDILDAVLVIAATSSSLVNERIAADAQLTGRPVNVANAPEKGSFDFLAAHRAGEITVGVSAGGVPAAAMRIRDAIAERIDSRYAEAVAECAELREKTLEEIGSDRWRAVSADLIDESFCRSVENGAFAKKVATWR